MRPDGSPAPAVSNDSLDTPRPSPRPARLRWLAALWCAAAAATATAGADTCGPSRVDARAHVAYVYDGDTVRLDDGRRIRLIGVDTPEIAHDGNPAQPFALAARQFLIDLLHQSGGDVRLRYGPERKDHYHRTLAHLYLPDGQS
ncbi:MAG TPA: thermonuclease family protein, partial [Gammaproteobacteria bacterium]|nr:thermonuclease family protein [Gammaproteobacteria bacterium]